MMMMGAALGIKDLREKWLTKQERFMYESAGSSNNLDPQLRNRKNDGNDISSVEDQNRMLKFKQKKTTTENALANPNSTEAANGSSKIVYNLTEHS